MVPTFEDWTKRIAVEKYQFLVKDLKDVLAANGMWSETFILCLNSLYNEKADLLELMNEAVELYQAKKNAFLARNLTYFIMKTLPEIYQSTITATGTAIVKREIDFNNDGVIMTNCSTPSSSCPVQRESCANARAMPSGQLFCAGSSDGAEQSQELCKFDMTFGEDLSTVEGVRTEDVGWMFDTPSFASSHHMGTHLPTTEVTLAGMLKHKKANKRTALVGRGPRPFDCTYGCGRSFLHRRNCNRHESYNCEQRPLVLAKFPCQICSKAFNRLDLMKRHQKLNCPVKRVDVRDDRMSIGNNNVSELVAQSVAVPSPLPQTQSLNSQTN